MYSVYFQQRKRNRLKEKFCVVAVLLNAFKRLITNDRRYFTNFDFTNGIDIKNQKT